MSDLPEGLRTRLVEAGRGKVPPNHLLLGREGWGLKVFGFLLGGGAVGGATTNALTYHYPFKPDEAGVHAAIIAAGCIFLLVSLANIVRRARNTMRPVQLAGQGFRIEAGFDHDPVTVQVFQGQPLPPEYAPWFKDLAAKPEAPSGSSGFLRFFGLVLLALALTAVSFPFMWISNVRYTDGLYWGFAERGTWVSGSTYEKTAKAYEQYLDFQQWHVRVPDWLRARTQLDERAQRAKELIDDLSAEEAKTATQLRAHRARFPQSKNAAKVKEKLHKLYVEVESAYTAQAKTAGADPRAAEGMRALLAFLRESDEPTVRIQFLPVEGLEGGPIEKLAAAKSGSKNVQPVGPSFTAERNKARENRIIQGLERAFARVFPGDVFQLDTKGVKKSGPRFLVKYKVLGSGAVYSFESEKDLPAEDVHVYPGILLAFDFTLQVPSLDAELTDDVAKGYRYSMVARPALNFSVRTSGSGLPSATVVYDTMAGTAFNQFEESLAKAYGIGAGAAAEGTEGR